MRGGRGTAVRRQLTKSFMCRSFWMFVAVAVLAVFCGIRLVQYQILGTDNYAQAATSSRTVTRPIPSRRGTIQDSKGRILAQSLQTYTVFADQQAIAAFKPIACSSTNMSVCHQVEGKPLTTKGAEAVAQLLAPVLQMDQKRLRAELTGTSRYRVLRKEVDPSVKRNIDKLHLSGEIGTELTSRRAYPAGSVLGSVLGSVNSQGQGTSGVEMMANSVLSGENGSTTYQRGANGQQIPGTTTTTRPAKNGGSVRLTIDSDAQWFAEKALRDGQKANHAKWGIAIVQEVRTGRLVAIADTDDVRAGSPNAALSGSKAITTVFEPGSTGKILTAANLIEHGLHQPTDRFSVPYQTTLNGQTYHDSHEHGVQQLTLAGIIQQSSNVGIVMASQDLSNQERYDFLRRMGIGQTSGIGFPGESAGLLSPYKTWGERQSQTILFGQGYAASALQMTNAVSTIADKGIKRQQSLISSTTDADGRTTKTGTGTGTRVLSAKTCSEVLDMMESVTDMYKKVVNVPGYRIAGKSGTAQVSEDGEKALNHTIGDWIGVIPADDPQYTVMVAYLDPTPIYGGLAAGPVMAQIGGFLMQQHNVPVSAPRTDAIPTKW